MGNWEIIRKLFEPILGFASNLGMFLSNIRRDCRRNPLQRRCEYVVSEELRAPCGFSDGEINNGLIGIGQN